MTQATVLIQLSLKPCSIDSATEQESYDKCIVSKCWKPIFNNIFANILGPALGTQDTYHVGCLAVNITALIISKFAYVVNILSVQL